MEAYKKCSNCFEFKTHAEFYTRVQSGKITTQSRCKACNAEVCKGWRERKRRGKNY